MIFQKVKNMILVKNKMNIRKKFIKQCMKESVGGKATDLKEKPRNRDSISKRISELNFLGVPKLVNVLQGNKTVTSGITGEMHISYHKTFLGAPGWLSG